MTAEPKPTRLEETRKRVAEQVCHTMDGWSTTEQDDCAWLLSEVDRLKEELQLSDEAFRRAQGDLLSLEHALQHTFPDDGAPLELTQVINAKRIVYHRVK